MYAWIENGVIRDLHPDPHSAFHPSIAELYSTVVSEDAQKGDSIEVVEDGAD